MKKIAAFGLFSAWLIQVGCGTQKENDHRVVYIAPVTPAEGSFIQTRVRFRQPILPGDSFAREDQEGGCNSFLAGLPPEFRRGYVQVPENWDQPDSRRIKVFYYARIAAQPPDRQNRPAVVFFNGEVGSDSHSSYRLLDRESHTLHSNIVFVDQRGTGCSDPLPSGNSQEITPLLKLYGTRSIVKDAEVIRTLLFGSQAKWRIFGEGFGGTIAHRYLQVAPEAIASVHSYGASIMSQAVEWATLKSLGQHRHEDDYFVIHPSDRDLLFKIRSSIGRAICFDDGTSRICGPEVMDAAAVMLNFRDSWESLHRWLLALHSDEGGLNWNVLQSFVRHFVFGIYSHRGFYAALIGKMEPTQEILDRDTCIRSMERLRSMGEVPDQWLIHECRLILSLRHTWDPSLERFNELDPIDFESLLSSLDRNPGIRFYLYSGRRDGTVPTETFSEELNRLQRRIIFREFPNSGHEGYYSEPLVWRDLSCH